ncbi:LytTR family DNA-binding domain-containing protein [Flavobacteriaceae bacterium F08102]|nr:LytTR family DNA-binding domain-containing protein [Flavobacteriaceae bacterium F08102]
MQYKYAIIEQDGSVVNHLQSNFENFANFTCVGTADNYDESIELVIEKNPQVVFINVDQSIGESAFQFIYELHNYLEQLPIFVAISSTKELSYQCIKHNFFDYLLKPISKFDLTKCVARITKASNLEPSQKLCLKSYKDYRFIEMEDILFLKADNTSTDIYMEDGTKISAYKTLKSYEAILPSNFTRIHNSYIVNRNYVSRIHFGKSKCTLKKTFDSIPFSKSYKHNVVLLEKALTKQALLSLN